MKTKQVLFILILIYWTPSFGQIVLPFRPYEKIIFDGLLPKWHETIYESNTVSDSSDGYNCIIKPKSVNDILSPDNTSIYTDNSIIKAYYRRYYLKDVAGTYLERRDLVTGKLIWQVYYGYPDENPDYARHMYVNNDGNIVVIGQKKSLPYGTKTIIVFDTMLVISKRIYDFNNGSLLSYESPQNIQNALKTDISLGLYQNSQFYNEDDHTRLINYDVDLNRIPTVLYRSALVDKNSSTKIKFDTLLPKFIRIPVLPIQINKNTYLIVENDTLQKKLFLRYVTKELKIIEEYYSEKSDLFNVFKENLNIAEIDRNNGNILIRIVKNSVPPNFVTFIKYLIIDNKGKLLSVYSTPSIYSNFVSMIEWKAVDTIYVLGQKLYDPPEGKVIFISEILQMTANNSIKVINTFSPTDSLRNANFEFYCLNNDEYIVNLGEYAIYDDPNTPGESYKFDFPAIARSTLRIKKSMIGIPTFTSDVAYSTFKLFPNPGSEYDLNIDLFEPTSGHLVISDIMGRIVKKEKIDETQAIKINVDDIHTGIYYIHMEDKIGHYKFKPQLWVKI